MPKYKPPIKDMVGFKSGRLTVIQKSNKTSSNGAYYWECECTCGNLVTVAGAFLRSRKRPTQSCGCLAKELSSQREKTHGLSNNPHFLRYMRMMKRCYDPKNKDYKTYGARGITVCSEWNGHPKAFVKWCERQNPEPHLTIDRRNNDKGYSPGNCQFSDKSVQALNRSNTRKIEHEGKTYSWIEFVQLFSVVTTACVYQRIKQGYDFKSAALTPDTRWNGKRA